MEDSSPGGDERDSEWVPPADTDLIGFPLFVGVVVAALAVAAAFIFIGGFAGLLLLVIVLILALAISYRVVTASDPGD